MVLTSEVAVMNRLAVALAADSAVTTPHQKVHNSANKLFMLSDREPVGFMVYNNAQLMNVPWETLVKDFRGKLGAISFKRLEQYAEAFFIYLSQMMHLFDADVEKAYYLELVEIHYRDIANQIRRKLRSQESAFALSATPAEVAERRATIHREVIGRHADRLADAPRSPWVNPDAGRDIAGLCSGEISELTIRIFVESYPALAGPEVQLLRQYAIDLVEAAPIAEESLSGVVFAGFGTDDYAPVLQAFEVGDVYGGRLKFNRSDPVRIGEDGRETYIETFADSGTADAFLRGLPAELEREIVEMAYEVAEQVSRQAIALCGVKGADRKALEEELAEVRVEELVEFVSGLKDYKQTVFVEPTELAISNLPKDELAHVAASLVNINLLKKRMSMTLETVGGPIDVAVISKGDGFIWIDRKQYFSTSRNPQFLFNRYGRIAQPDGEEGR